MIGYPAWPLHPPPGSFETLRMYVVRLAELYDVSCNEFCSRALRIPLTDYDALSLADPSDEVLERLSAGVGVPVDDLRSLRLDAVWARLLAELEAHVNTPEGRRLYGWMLR